MLLTPADIAGFAVLPLAATGVGMAVVLGVTSTVMVAVARRLLAAHARPTSARPLVSDRAAASSGTATTGLADHEPADSTGPDAAGADERPPVPESLLRVMAASMTEAELCLSWRRSFTALQRAECPQSVVQLAMPRQCCLDELERRLPGATAAWLKAGPRAAGGPERFITPPKR